MNIDVDGAVDQFKENYSKHIGELVGKITEDYIVNSCNHCD